MADWRPIETAPIKEDVLFLWNWPGTDAKPIIRIGQIMWKPFDGERPTVKLDMDIGDSSATFFMPKDDAPHHWMPLPPPPKENGDD